MTVLQQSTAYQADVAAQKAFLVKVYGWMTAGLMITALVAKLVAMSPALVKTVFGHGMGPLIVIFVAQLAIAFGLSIALNKISSMVAGVLFLLYAMLTGVCFAIYFLVFTEASIAAAFAVTSVTFAGMSVFGLVTKIDLSRLGSFLMMAFWGLIVASIVNMFWANSQLYWISTYAGVLIFVGLTAYDTQKIKYQYMVGSAGSEIQQKGAIMGAFVLYLDFILLLQYLLRILGEAKD